MTMPESTTLGRLGWAFRTARSARPKSLVGRLRLLWADFVLHGLFGPGGERCQDCGRPYPLWRAGDEMYRQVIGDRGGLFCPACFDERAKAGGLRLQWIPRPWGASDENDSH